MKRCVLFIVTALLVPSAFTQSSRFEIDSLAWLAGCWEGRYENGRIVTEQWMKPLGKVMMSMSRTVKNGETVGCEYVRLEQAEDGVIRYIAYPSGQAETSFLLVKLEGKKALFANPEHDFPQRIIYQWISPDSIFARIEGTIEGKEKSSNFPYRRVKCE